MLSVVAMSVTERPTLKSFTASSALSLADGLLPKYRFSAFAFAMISAWVGLPHPSSPNEFSMVMLWRDLDALKGFTGDKWQNAVIGPAEKHLLAETHVYHYEVDEV